MPVRALNQTLRGQVIMHDFIKLSFLDVYSALDIFPLYIRRLMAILLPVLGIE